MLEWNSSTKTNVDSLLDLLIDYSKPEDYVTVKLDAEEVLFMLVRNRDTRNMQIEIVAVRLIGSVAHYAVMSEQDRPEEYLCCPKRLLDQSEVPDVSGWCEACKRHQAA